MNKKFFKIFGVLILLLLSSFNTFILADDVLPEPSREFYVYDEANIIDSDAERYIISVNEELYAKTGAQVVVASVNSLNERDIEGYANELFRKWQIGDKDKDNGALILVAPNEKLLRIEVGYGLEGAIPDGKAGAIRDQYMIPYFKSGDYSQGILEAFKAIILLVENEYDITLDKTAQIDDYDINNIEKTGNLFSSIKRVVLVIVILILIFIDFRFFGGFLTYALLRSLARGGRGGSGRGGGGSFGGGNSGGGGSSGGGGASGGW